MVVPTNETYITITKPKFLMFKVGRTIPTDIEIETIDLITKMQVGVVIYNDQEQNILSG